MTEIRLFRERTERRKERGGGGEGREKKGTELEESRRMGREKKYGAAGKHHMDLGGERVTPAARP